MKCFISISLVILFVAAFSRTTIAERCSQHNCLTREKCDGVYDQGICSSPTHVCCLSVRPEYQTKCRHFGGECMKNCNPRLHVDSVRDCPVNTQCCVLIS